MMILAVMMVMTISATAMSYNAAKHEALFLSDKMAYELNLTAAQYVSCWTPGSTISTSPWPTSIAPWHGGPTAGYSMCTPAMTEVISTTHIPRCS